jgi:hypothetical protein
MTSWQSTQLDCVHIHCCGNGHLGFRPDGGSLLNSAKVSKTLLPHHSAPRLGSVCPNAGLNPWAAVMGHPWPRTANPASCRVTHEFKPAFGQRGLTGRLRSRSRAARFASWLPGRLLQPTKLCRYLWLSQQASSHIFICVMSVPAVPAVPPVRQSALPALQYAPLKQRPRYAPLGSPART